MTHQLGHRDGGNLPHLVDVDAVVVVGEQDPQGTDISPRNARTSSRERITESGARFTDDLQQALCGAPMQHALAEGLTTDSDDQRELVGRLEDVGDALVVAATHSGTASRRM